MSLHKFMGERSSGLTADHWNLLPYNVEVSMYASPSFFFFRHVLMVTVGSRH